MCDNANCESFVCSILYDQVCFFLDCQQVIVFGGTVGNLSDHEGRTKHRRKVAERRGPHEQDSPALSVTRQLSYCAFHGYAFDHMEKPETGPRCSARTG